MKNLFARAYSFLLVALQLGALLYLAVTGPIIATSMPLFMLQLLGVCVGLAALWRMGGSPWRVTPDLHPRARLITSGIYRHIRHPMYTSVLIMAYTWLVSSYRTERLYVFILLILVLWLKLRKEEQSLRERFGKPYVDYAKRTYRLIPKIY